MHGKIVSIAFLMPEEDADSLYEKRHPLTLVLREILLKRLKVSKLITKKDYFGPVDFFFIETDAREIGSSSRSNSVQLPFNSNMSLKQVKEYVHSRRDLDGFTKKMQANWTQKWKAS